MKREMKSPYSAAMTGCGFMWEEMTNILPLLMSSDSSDLLKKEVVENKFLMMRTEKTRRRAMDEMKRRFNAVTPYFWERYMDLSKEAKIVAMYYVNLKCYKLLFDLHLNVVMKKWNSVRQSISKVDLVLGINEIGANDEFVAGWSDNTKDKVAGACLTFLRKAGFLTEKTGDLTSIHLSDDDFKFYLELGEPWFLEACLLQPYEINRIKQAAL